MYNVPLAQRGRPPNTGSYTWPLVTWVLSALAGATILGILAMVFYVTRLIAAAN